MPKKVRKETLQEGDATLTRVSKYTFKTEYETWVNTCKGHSGGSRTGKTLWDYVRLHGRKKRATTTHRDRSGGLGATIRLLDKIVKDTKYTDNDVKNLREALNKLEDMGDVDSPNNPANIQFSVPEKYDSKGNYKEGIKFVPIYGHYLDKYFATKHGAKNMETEGWVSSDKGKARPPLYQAIFGGTIFKIGLLDIVRHALEEIDGAIYTAVIDSSKASTELLKVPQIKSATTGWLRKATSGNKVSVSKMKGAMTSRVFNIKSPAEEKVIRQYANIGDDFVGKIVKYRFELSDEDVKEYVRAYWGGLKGRDRSEYMTLEKWMRQLKEVEFIA